MTKININELNRYDSKDIYEFLFLQNETVFQITIARKTVARKSENYDVFEEYLLAAYAGQRLSEIAKSFAYYVPSVCSKRPFVFEVTITEMGKLAEVLYIIIHSGNDKIPGEIFLAFHSLAADFLTNAFNEKMECNTWGLLCIANKYLEKSDNS